MSSIFKSKNLAILKAKIIEGLYFPVSKELIVCLVTPRTSANSDWLIFFDFLSNSILFFKISPAHKCKANFTFILTH